MRYQIPVIILFVCVLIGCNADPRSRRETALLRSEILDLEDQYYALQSDHERTLERLSACSGVPVDQLLRENRSLVGSGLNRRKKRTFTDDDCIGCETIITESPYSVDSTPAPSTPGEPGVQSEIRSPSHPTQKPNSSRSILDLPQNPNLEVPQAQKNSPQTRTRQSARSRSVSDAKELVTEIYIHPELTRATDIDQQIGDDGISVFLQPRTPRGKTVLKPGKLTIRIVDPTAPVSQKNIGTWTFTPTELKFFKNSNSIGQHGYQLRLPWALNTPVSKRLLLSVRFTTSDGRHLETSRPVQILPPGDQYTPDAPLIAEWTIDSPTSDPVSEEAINLDIDLSPPSGSIRRGIRALPAKTKLNRTKLNRKSRWKPVR